MRRLVAISNKTQKAILALMAVILSLTSIHVAAAARIASLRRQQEKIEHLTAGAQPAIPAQNPSPSAASSADQSQPAASPETQARKSDSVQQGKFNAAAEAGNSGSTRKRQIIISIADRKLALMEDGQLLKTYPIAVGASRTPSPEGDFVIINHAKDPTYRHGSREILPGKDNPLGSRWMGLNLKGYGIHGTNVQSSIGKAASHGCFRMRKQDVEELYGLVQVGDTVTIRRERDGLIAQVFAAPAAPSAAMAVKSQGNAETQVASATVMTVETTQE